MEKGYLFNLVNPLERDGVYFLAAIFAAIWIEPAITVKITIGLQMISTNIFIASFLFEYIYVNSHILYICQFTYFTIKTIYKKIKCGISQHLFKNPKKFF